MQIFKMLEVNCLELIIEFAGIKEQWQHCFSMDVLPKIEQGWKEVGLDDNNTPCAICYVFDKKCPTCKLYNNRMVIKKFEEMREITPPFEKFDSFLTFKKCKCWELEMLKHKVEMYVFRV